jgi:hypothetical protein
MNFVPFRALFLANFYEKALFVKVDVAASVWPSVTGPALRAMLLSALSGSSRFGGSVHRMGSDFIRALLRRCNLPSGLPRGWARFAWRSHLTLDPKRYLG